MFGSIASHTGDFEFLFQDIFMDDIDDWLRDHKMRFYIETCVNAEPHPMGGPPFLRENGLKRIRFLDTDQAMLFKLRWC